MALPLAATLLKKHDPKDAEAFPELLPKTIDPLAERPSKCEVPVCLHHGKVGELSIGHGGKATDAVPEHRAVNWPRPSPGQLDRPLRQTSNHGR